MEKADAEKIVEFINDELLGFTDGPDEEATIHEGYSGRGMYGESTTGITVEREAYVYYAMAKLDMDFQMLSRDAMGRDSIILY